MRQAERGLQDLVTTTGYVDEPRKIELLHNAGLFMYPSETDTFGISVVEAMSSGVPSIVPRGFPLAHYDDMEVSGLIEMDFSRPDEIAGAVERYSADRQILRAVGEAARKFVLDNFSMEKHCDILLSTYADLLSGGSMKSASGKVHYHNVRANDNCIGNNTKQRYPVAQCYSCQEN